MMSLTRRILSLLVAASLAALLGCAFEDEDGFRLVGLTDKGELARFRPEKLNEVRLLPITGVGAAIRGIDFRISDRTLYGLGADNVVYRIDATNGAARRVSTLGRALPAGPVIVDFEPKTDGMRVITQEGGSFLINVDTGAVTVEKPLAYAADDRNAGKTPRLTGGAHINAYPGAFATQVFAMDAAQATYVVADPPEGGVLRTVGPTGMPAGTVVSGFDILTDIAYEYFGFAAEGRTIYRVDVGRGSATRLGDIALIDRVLIDLAIWPLPPPRPPSKGGSYEG